MHADDGPQSQPSTIDWEAAQPAVELLAGKWVLMLIRELARDARRHNELRKALGNDVADKVLTRALRRMEAAGIATREIVSTSPPGVRYSLAPLGQSLLEPLDGLARHWREHHELEVGVRPPHIDEEDPT